VELHQVGSDPQQMIGCLSGGTLKAMLTQYTCIHVTPWTPAITC